MEKHIRPLFSDKRIQTSDELDTITTYLGGRSGRRDFGHDLLDVWTAIFKIAKEAGLKQNWDLCSFCKGEGEIE